MTQEEFLTELSNVVTKYSWCYDNNTIRGVVLRGNDRGLTVNPVTA